MNKKVVSIAAQSLAAVVMAGALVYYNFIDKVPTEEKAKVGTACADFTVQRIVDDGTNFSVSNETYTFSENQGKVRIINMWAIWCAACVAELPEFDEFAKDYPEVDVLALTDGSCGSLSGVMEWLGDRGWTAYDATGEWLGRAYKIGFSERIDLLKELGSTGMLPVTVIVDQEGTIVYKKKSTVTYEDLKAVVEPLLANE